MGQVNFAEEVKQITCNSLRMKLSDYAEDLRRCKSISTKRIISEKFSNDLELLEKLSEIYPE